MRLYDLLQAYEFDEIMPVVVDMFPGTGKFREQLKEAWNMLLDMKPVASKKVIKYKLMQGDRADEQYIGAEDRDLGVDLNDAEMLANCLVNICLIGKHPHSFEKSYRILSTPDR